jgi:hypothetical protein
LSDKLIYFVFYSNKVNKLKIQNYVDLFIFIIKTFILEKKFLF